MFRRQVLTLSKHGGGIISFANYYFLDNHSKLQKYIDCYIPLVEVVLSQYSISLFSDEIKGDHIGVQTVSTI